MLRFFGSLKLTLALLLGLALVSIAGTFQPLAEGRYDIFYQSPWFRLLLGLLAVNLGVCTLTTIRRNLGDRQRLLEGLQGEQAFAATLRFVLPAGDPAPLAERLRAGGYRVDAGSGTLLGRAGLAGRWGSTAVHLAVLGIMLGALGAEFGFVGTHSLRVGEQSDRYYDWDQEADRPLGFTLRLDRFEPVFYPIDLQFAAIDPVTRQALETYTVTEGDEVDLPVPGVRAKVLRFFPNEEDLLLGISRNGQYLGEYHAMGGRHTAPNSVDPGVELRPVAFRDPILKQLHSEVSVLEEGKVVRQAAIEVNQPLDHRGIRIYLTAYSKDEYGFWAAGFQFTRDPAEVVVWLGCLVLVAGLACAFLVPYRAVGITRSGDELLLVGLAGFRGEAGAERFQQLGQFLGEAPAPAPDADA